MLEIGNSWWMYLLGIIVTVFVLVGCLFFIFKAYREAKQLNMDKQVLKKTVISSTIFTILPSISILVGIFALAGQLGIPLPWIRLSVIGALHYEGFAASTALGLLPEGSTAATQIVTVASVMTLGIISGPLFCLFGFKAYEKKLLSKATSTPVEDDSQPVQGIEAKPKKGFGDVLFNAVFIAMIGAFLVWDAVEPFIKYEDVVASSEYMKGKQYIPMIVIVVSFGCMALCDFLEKKCKQKWLSDFSLGISMIIGMASAAVVAML